jgi:hypothetical protein
MIVWIFVIIVLLYCLLSRDENIVEGFYEFVTPTSLTIPDMFKLSDESMEDVFNYDSRIITFKQRGLCK